MITMKTKKILLIAASTASLAFAADKSKYTVSPGTGGINTPHASVLTSSTRGFTTSYKSTKDAAIGNGVCVLGSTLKSGSAVMDDCLDKVFDNYVNSMPVQMGTVATPGSFPPGVDPAVALRLYNESKKQSVEVSRGGTIFDGVEHMYNPSTGGMVPRNNRRYKS